MAIFEKVTWGHGLPKVTWTKIVITKMDMDFQKYVKMDMAVEKDIVTNGYYAVNWDFK